MTYSTPDPQQQPNQQSSEQPNTPAGSVAGHATTTPSGIDERGHVRRGKVSAAWTGAIVAALLLIALIIFIAQNSAPVTIHFLGVHGRISLALALLIAAVGSVILVAIVGTLRILQLRRALKKNASARSVQR